MVEDDEDKLLRMAARVPKRYTNSKGSNHHQDSIAALHKKAWYCGCLAEH